MGGGLSVYIARRLVELLGGAIAVSSEPNKVNCRLIQPIGTGREWLTDSNIGLHSAHRTTIAIG